MGSEHAQPEDPVDGVKAGEGALADQVAQRLGRSAAQGAAARVDDFDHFYSAPRKQPLRLMERVIEQRAYRGGDVDEPVGEVVKDDIEPEAMTVE